jgi:hypothetical protein
VEAVDYVYRSTPRIPYLPQLPSYSPEESIIGQLGAWQKNRRLHDAAGFAALDAFCESTRRRNPTCVKLQLVGPWTAWRYSTPQTSLEDLGRDVGCVLYELGQRVGLPPDRTIMQLDEPAMPSIDQEGLVVIRHLIADLRSRGHQTWVHCCDAAPWELWTGLGADGWSFDLDRSFPPEPTAQWPKTLILGCVPTNDSRSADDCKLRLNGWLASAGLGEGSEVDLVLSPACGLGLRTMEQTRGVFETLRCLDSEPF